MSVRTLCNWEKDAGQAIKGPGRPSHSKEERWKALLAVLRVLRRIGYTSGWEPVAKELPDVALRLIHQSMKFLKKRQRVKMRAIFEKQRMHIEVHAQGALVSQDGTKLAEDTWVEVKVDQATFLGESRGDGKPACAKDVVDWLKEQKERGELPLVNATDRGSIYRAQEVEDYERQEKVIHLFSRCQTPQDNARGEHIIGEGKGEACIGLKKCFNYPEGWLGNFSQALKRLNRRPRKSRGWLSADQAQLTMPSWRAFTTRDEFYEKANAAVAKAVSIATSKRDLQQLQRLAILGTMEEVGLISITRGNHSLSTRKEEIIS